MEDKELIKKEILKIAAITDRGQRLNKLIAPVYQEKLTEIYHLLDKLYERSESLTKEKLEGEWELIFSDVELFRSSPFFLAIEKALDSKFKSDLFFKLHQLQVSSFGLSTIGRIQQFIDFQGDTFISTFDTTIFGLTTIPIIGWFKLFPTFGGKVTTFANNLYLEKNDLRMNLIKTKVSELEGLNKIPFFSSILMDRWYPVKEIWDKLPWNKTSPSCEVSIKFIDEDFRVVSDIYGSIFIYTKS
tara:strand:- start:1926 stop:2657 length:732 start_codon:yes stop_codon:yes gene_type:complete